MLVNCAVVRMCVGRSSGGKNVSSSVSRFCGGSDVKILGGSPSTESESGYRLDCSSNSESG